jgi:hypothetical protein
MRFIASLFFIFLQKTQKTLSFQIAFLSGLTPKLRVLYVKGLVESRGKLAILTFVVKKAYFRGESYAFCGVLGVLSGDLGFCFLVEGVCSYGQAEKVWVVVFEVFGVIEPLDDEFFVCTEDIALEVFYVSIA